MLVSIEERAELFREIDRGGKFRRRTPVAGEGQTLRETGERTLRGGKQWEVLCGGCGRVQLRDSGQINWALRRGSEHTCPECLIEMQRGLSVDFCNKRSADRLERVKSGGPVWTAMETQYLQFQIRRDLEVEFGPLPEPVFKVSDLDYQANWPGAEFFTLPQNLENRYGGDEFSEEDLASVLEARALAEKAQQKANIKKRREKAMQESAAYHWTRKMGRVEGWSLKEQFTFGATLARAKRWERVAMGEDIVHPDKITRRDAEQAFVAWYTVEKKAKRIP